MNASTTDRRCVIAASAACAFPPRSSISESPNPTSPSTSARLRGTRKRGEITATIQQKKPFPGSAKATLLRLPKGVKAGRTGPEITAKDTEVVFHVQADSDALLGIYKEIACEVTVSDKGQSIHQQTGSGILRVDPARSATVSTR